MQRTPFPYVAYIGLRSVTLGGANAIEYQTDISEIRKGDVVNRFENEGELNAFLQQCIDKEFPFADDLKTNAFMEAEFLKKNGVLTGEIRSVTWDMNGKPRIGPPA
ncbi:hypothetical protein [Alterisphingorhabdus coralli]|uniref:Uncharacterized protein n=1 Tax=Alterisphingorhabdus coralli TaxID=3071408 RepID=A0AA97F486_9SPHN|nr:hypothetical protein [Parasphingorhabdus sp. SCSIO 66989]WOE74039.1 hypothetical protein RB602_09210 [Parasphingorhabdus sp. SCSIO 66989]